MLDAGDCLAEQQVCSLIAKGNAVKGAPANVAVQPLNERVRIQDFAGLIDEPERRDPGQQASRWRRGQRSGDAIARSSGPHGRCVGAAGPKTRIPEASTGPRANSRSRLMEKVSPVGHRGIAVPATKAQSSRKQNVPIKGILFHFIGRIDILLGHKAGISLAACRRLKRSQRATQPLFTSAAPAPPNRHQVELVQWCMLLLDMKSRPARTARGLPNQRGLGARIPGTKEHS